MPGNSAGSIYAEATLDITKFTAGASQLNSESMRILSAMKKAASGLSGAQMEVSKLADSINLTKSQIAAANSILNVSATTLQDLQMAAESAAIKAADLGKVYEKNAASLGDSNFITYESKRAYEEAATSADELAAKVERQRAVVDKNTISVQKYQNTLKDLERRTTSADSKIEDFASTISDLNKQLIESTAAKIPESFDAASMAATTFEDVLEVVKKKGLRGLGPGLSFVIGQMDAVKESTGAAALIMKAFQSSAGSIMTSLTRANVASTAILATAAATVYGAGKLFRYATGATAAKEALDGLVETSEKWKESQAKTVYDTGNDPFVSIGISESDFAKVNTPAGKWVDSLVKTWTDGKGETDAIVSKYVDSFIEGSDKIREAVESRKSALEGLGIEDTNANEALAQLDAYDKEIEALLKKRQNGFLTEDEIARLNEISTAKIELEAEYGLKEASGFEKILEAVEADNARLQALGKGPSVDTYADAMKAAALGLNDYKTALDSTYTEQYQLIQGMEDGAEKTRAIERLNQQYAADMAAGLQEYASTLSQLYGTVWQSADVQNGEQGLKNIADLITQFNAGTLTENNLITQLNDQLKQLDESSLVSYMAVATQIVDLFNQGMTVTDLQNLFPEIDITQMLGGYSTIADFLSAHTGQFEGLEGIFGQGGAVPEEMQRVMATLELDTEALDTLLETPQEVKIKFDASDATIEQPDPINVLIAAYEKATDVGMPPDAMVEAVITGYKQEGSVTVVDWQAAAKAIIGYFDANPEAAVNDTAIKNLTAYIGKYDDSGAVVPTIEPITVEVIYERVQSGSEKLGAGSVKLFDTPFVNSTTEKVQVLTEAIQSLGTESQMLNLDQLNTSLEALQNTGEVGTIITFLNDVNAAVQAGQQLSPEVQTQVQTLLDFIAALDTTPVGEDVSEGIAEGLVAFGWATTAATLAADIETALRTACETHSPSTLTKPIGADITAGIGEGMLDTASITAAAAQVSADTISAMMANMASSTMIGLNFSRGLAAGIRSGRSGVISAAASVARAAAAAAKSELDIHSPSGVTEEFGEFYDLGFIKGIKNFTPEIDDAVREALYIEPPHGAAYGGYSAPQPAPNISVPIDYERLAEAMSAVQMRMYMNDRAVAEATAKETARAQNGRSRSIALGYGVKGRR